MSTFIQLDEEIEGDQIGSKNYRFSRIGTPVPIKSGEDSSFDIENECPPLQPLVVSERFRLLFVAHSNGQFLYNLVRLFHSVTSELR